MRLLMPMTLCRYDAISVNILRGCRILVCLPCFHLVCLVYLIADTCSTATDDGHRRGSWSTSSFHFSVLPRNTRMRDSEAPLSR